MATNELELKLTIDTATFQQGLKAVAGNAETTQKAIQAAFKGLDLKLDSAQAGKAFSEVNRAAKETVDQQKQALAALIATGQKGSAEYKQLQTELLQSAAAAAKLDDAVKQVDDQIAKTASSGSSFASVFAGVSLGGLASGALQSVFSGFGEAIQGAQDFQQNMAGLSAITGVTGAGLDDLGQRARDLALKFGGDANAQLSAFQGILSKFGADLAKSPEELGKLSENVNILAKAGGLDAAQAMDALTNSMLQFGVSAEDPKVAAAESSRFINVLAASAKVGAAEIPQVAEAVLQAGVSARSANVSFEETNAALQALAVGGKVGSEAGISLRNVMGLLQKQSGEGEKALNGVGLSVKDLGETLTTKGLAAALEQLQGGIDKLGTDAEKNSFRMQLFGAENANAAGLLLDSVSTIRDFTEGVTGTSDAIDQAAVNMNTFGERIERLKAGIQDGFIGAFQTLAPIISQVLDGIVPRIAAAFGNIFSALAPTLEIVGTIFGGAVLIAVEAFTAVLTKIGEGLQLIAPILPFVAGGVAAYAVATNAAAIGTAAASAAQAVLNAVMSANPIGLVVVAVVALAAAYAGLADVLTDSAEEQLEAAEAQKKATEAQIADNKAKQQGARDTKLLVGEFTQLANKSNLTAAEQDRLREIQGELDKQYPDLIDQTKSFSENLAGVAEIGNRTTAELRNLSAEGRELEAQLKAAEGAIASAKRNIAVEELRDVFNTGAFLNSFRAIGDLSGAEFRVAFGKNLAGFEQVLFSAKTTEQIDRARAQLLEFVNTNKEALDDPEKLVELYGKIDAAVTASKTALKAYGLAQDEVAAKAEAAKPAVPEQADTAKTVAENEDLIAKLKEQLDLRKAMLANQLAEATAREKELAISQNFSEITEAQKERLAALEIRQRTELEAYGKELFKITQTQEGQLAVGVALPKEDTDKVRQDVLALILQLTKDLQDSQLRAIKMGLDGQDLEKQASTLLQNLREVVKNGAKAVVNLEIPIADFERDSQTALDRIAALQPELEAELAKAIEAGDAKRQQSLEKQLLTLKKALEDLTAEREDAIEKATDKTINRDLALITDAVEREYLTKKRGLEKQRAEQLKQAGLTAEQRVEIEKRYQDSLAKLEDDYFRAKNEKLFKYGEKLGEVIGSLFESPELDTEALSNLDNEESAQLASLKKREANYQAYSDKLTEIDSERQAVLDAANVSLEERLGKAFKKLGEAAAGQTDSLLASFQEQAEAGDIAYTTIGAAAALNFAGIVAAGESAGTAILKSLLEIAQKAIAIYTPQIIAAFTSLLGPFGIPAAFSAIALVNGLLGAAASGFAEGGYTGDGAATAIAGVVHGREFVHNAQVTAKYRPLFEHLHAGKDLDTYQPANVQAADIAILADKLDGIQQGLANLSTRVETVATVRGELRADGNGISAVIDNAKSRYYSRA